MEDLILISNLNDFIFCPVSIYFHKLYGNQDNLTYFDNVQWNGRKPRIKSDYVNVVLDIGYTMLLILLMQCCRCMDLIHIMGCFISVSI